MEETHTSKIDIVQVMTNASAFVMPRPVRNVHDTHARIWSEMSEESLQKMFEVFLAEGSVKKTADGTSFRVNYDVVERDSEMAKAIKAFMDVYSPAAYYQEQRTMETLEIPIPENNGLVEDDLEATMEARRII